MARHYRVTQKVYRPIFSVHFYRCKHIVTKINRIVESRRYHKFTFLIDETVLPALFYNSQTMRETLQLVHRFKLRLNDKPIQFVYETDIPI